MISKQKKLRTDSRGHWQHFLDGIIIGLGWAVGATLGFVIISTLLVVVLQGLGGLPLVGGWIASIVDVTQEQLIKRTPIIPQ